MRYLLAIVLYIFATQSQAVINQIEAEVGENAVSSRDLLVNLAVEQVVFLKKKKVTFPKINSSDFKEKVSSYIIEAMVFNEAELTIDKKLVPGPRVANKVLKAIKRNMQWKNIRPSLSEIQKVIDIKYTSKEVLKKRIELAKVPISDQEVTVYFEQNKKDFGGVTIDKFKENIRALLSQKDIDKKLADWISFLRTKYSPENIASTR